MKNIITALVLILLSISFGIECDKPYHFDYMGLFMCIGFGIVGLVVLIDAIPNKKRG